MHNFLNFINATCTQIGLSVTRVRAESQPESTLPTGNGGGRRVAGVRKFVHTRILMNKHTAVAAARTDRTPE